METIIFGQWWRSHQSFACKCLCILRFCVMLWKDESEPNIKFCLGTAVGLVQRFITVQNFGQLTENRWNSSGIFPTIHHIAARPRSPKVHDQNGRSITFQRTNYLHVDVQWHHMEIWRQWTGMHCKCHTCDLICKKISTRTLVILRTWIGKEVVFYLHGQTTRRMEQSCWTNDDQVQRKRTPSFPSHESIINTLLCRWGNGWNCFSHKKIISANQLSIYGAVSDLCDEYSACQARTVRPILSGQSDPLFEPARLLMTTPKPLTEVLAQENFLKVQRTSGKALTTRSIVKKFCTVAGFPGTSWSRTELHDKGHWRVLTIYRTSDMSWVHFATKWKIVWPDRLDLREHQNWARVGSHNQVPARYIWIGKLELNL